MSTFSEWIKSLYVILSISMISLNLDGAKPVIVRLTFLVIRTYSIDYYVSTRELILSFALSKIEQLFIGKYMSLALSLFIYGL